LIMKKVRFNHYFSFASKYGSQIVDIINDNNVEGRKTKRVGQRVNNSS